MANIKSFNLVGVGSQVQFGKGGLQIAQDSGAFAFRDPTNTTLVNVEVATPTQANHAVNLDYVNGLVQGLDVKQSVRAAAASNITLSGTQTVDGVSLNVGDRVLVMGQTNAANNGIYVVAAGAWAYSADASTSADVTSGLFTFVSEGTTLAGTGWVLTTVNPITLGTTPLTFTQFSQAGVIQAGNGLAKNGNVLSAVGTAGQIAVSSSGISIDPTYAGQSSINTLGTVSAGTWNGSTVGVPYGGTGATSFTSGQLVVGNGAGALTTLAAGAANTFLVSNGTTYSFGTVDIDNLGNVTITSPANDQVLQYNSSTGKWSNATLAAANVSYSNTNANLAGNPSTVQAAIDAVAAEVATNAANGLAHIRNNATSPTAQVATDEVTGAVTIDVSNGTTAARIATFTGGVSDSSLNIDNSVSGEISIDAFSSTVSDVNVYINPQGNGKVYIGNGASDSELQADDGQDLTLAGGDNSATDGNGGNLILKAGHASNGGTDGQVVVQDGAGNNVAVFNETASADSYINVTNGVAQATIGVGSSSETNADLVLAPLGTGAVNVSGAAIHDVATPVNSTDAANKAYVDAQVAAAESAASAALVGSFQNEVGTITTATANLSNPIVGEIRNVTVQIQTPYVGGATIQIGTAANPTLISDGTTLDETSAGMYPITCSVVLGTATQLVATIVGSPSAGAARVLIDYVQGAA
jgi:hypothetical protein